MVNNTNNPLELLIGIRADTSGTKASIQSQLAKLSSELKGLELGVTIDDSGFKAIEKGAKSSFSGMSSSADKLAADLINSFDGMNKKVTQQISDIENQLKGKDFTIKTDFDIKNGQQSLKGLQVDVKETEDIISRITYGVKNVDGEVQLVEKHVKEINSEAFNLSKNFNDTTSKLKILHQEGKIATDTFKDLSDKAKNITTGEGFKDLDREIKEATSSHKVLMDNMKQQETTERQLQSARQKTIEQLERMSKAGQIDYSQAGAFTDTANTAKSVEEINRLRQSIALTAQDYKKVSQEAGKSSVAFTNLNHRIEDLTISTKLSSKEADVWRSKFNSTTSADGIKIINRELDVHLNKQKQANIELRQQETNQKKLNALVNEMTRVQNKNPVAFAQGANPQFDNLLKEIKQIDPATQKAKQSIDEASNSLSRMKAEATAAGRESMTFMDSFRVAMEKFPVWMAASTAFYSTIRGIRDVFTQIVALDSQMTTLKRVGGEGLDVNKTLAEAVELAGKLGNEIADINEGFISFARQGFRGESLANMTEMAVLLGNISELSVEDASSILTAGMKAFNIEAENSIRIVDSLNEVDNNYSITTVQLAESVQRAAGTASVYGELYAA